MNLGAFREREADELRGIQGEAVRRMNLGRFPSPVRRPLPQDE